MTGAVACWACGAAARPESSWTPVELYQCPECRLLFAPDRTAEDLQRLYDAGYFEEYPGGEGYEDDAAQRAYEAARRIDFVRRYRSGGRLLEVGAAAGHFVAAAAAEGFEPTGVEPAAELAERASERLRLPIVAGFIEDIELPDGGFDVACAWHVVEHLSDPLEALRRIRRALRPGGHLLVEVPNLSSVYARRQGKRWANLDLRHHVAHYTPAALRALLERAGMSSLTSRRSRCGAILRPGRALQPLELAAAVKEVALVRAHPRRAHPVRHEMLRAVAVAPPPTT